MRLPIQRLEAAAIMPTQAHGGDAGFDLHALEGGKIAPGERTQVRTGIAVELPDRHAGLVLPRSGLAAQHGITLVNAPGLIDSGYRGEINVLLINTDREAAFEYAAGDRIAQLVVVRIETPDIIELNALSDTERGAGGFGSSGG